MEFRRLLRGLLSRLNALLGDTSGATLTLTGVLGLAVLYALYQVREQQGRKEDEPGEPSTSGAAHAAAGGGGGPSTSAAAAAGGGGAAATGGAGAAAAVARRLGAVRRVTISVPGVLLEEWTPGELQDGATLRPEAPALLRDLLRTAEVYLLAHVGGDIGEAVVRGALEHSGILGSGPGRIAPHRALFCSTLDGKTSIVRQLEPGLHIDGHPSTISQLQRFIAQLVYVERPAAAAAAGSAAPAGPNVQQAPSLAAAFGVAL